MTIEPSKAFWAISVSDIALVGPIDELVQPKALLVPVLLVVIGSIQGENGGSQQYEKVSEDQNGILTFPIKYRPSRSCPVSGWALLKEGSTISSSKRL